MTVLTTVAPEERVVLALPLAVVDDDTPETARPFPIEETTLHEDVAGAVCASGVAGSPWWKVDVP